MNANKFNKKIGDLVGQDRLIEAITLLSKTLKGSPKLNEAIIQSSRLTDLMKQIRNGTVNFEDSNVTKNKIRIAILSLSDEIEQKVNSDDYLKKEFESKSSSSIRFNINQSHSGSGDNVGGDKITYSK